MSWRILVGLGDQAGGEGLSGKIRTTVEARVAEARRGWDFTESACPVVGAGAAPCSAGTGCARGCDSCLPAVGSAATLDVAARADEVTLAAAAACRAGAGSTSSCDINLRAVLATVALRPTEVANPITLTAAAACRA